jgi:DNA-binding MarR family transcriptional regulator
MATPHHVREWQRLSGDERAAWAGFLRTYPSIVGRLNSQFLEEHGLTFSEYDVMIQLSVAGREGLRMHVLADKVLLSRSAITRLIERLEAQGLVDRRGGQGRGRVVSAHITRKGIRRLAEVTPAHLAGVRKVFLDRLTRAQIKQLAAIWEKLLVPADETNAEC